ncbi:NPC intracellular cholesterol transporter 1 isoform X2 [Cephus cinctus]|nr:NPC intracellular cholesterol transporter 1 isoform X2 [Cephus cinctus]
MEDAVKDIVVNNQTWRDVCAGYFTWFQSDVVEEPLIEPEFIGGFYDKLNMSSLENKCIYQSILEIWSNEKLKDIHNFTKEEILNDVNKAFRNTTNNNMLLDIAALLSDMQFDESGRVTGATATILNWILKKSNPHSAEWELEFIEKVLYSNRSLPEGMHVYAVASRSFTDFLHQVLNNNMTILFCGLSLIAIYVIIMIGRCNIVQQRIYLSIVGVSVVGQAILSAYGLCYYMGYYYGPIHPILPFLLLGIGVDDMFVIMQSLENLSDSDKSQKIPLKIAKALQHSGMSITLTSITNIVAFAIGITTVMPFLESFCAFATLGILFLYIFEITFFVSCLVFDERRLELNKEGCCCQRKQQWIPNECSQRNTQQEIFKRYIGPFVIKPTVKMIVIFLTGCFLTVNIYGIFQLEQNFDPLWYLNQDSYPIQFHNKLKEYFPKYGKRAGIYMAGVDYYEDETELALLMNALRYNPYVNNRTVDSWFEGYQKWLNKTNKEIVDRDEYFGYLSEYLLFTLEGQAFIKDIKFDRLPIDDYNITTSQIQIQHILLNTTSDQVQAMESIRKTVKAVNFTQSHAHVAIFSPDYVSWTANKIIGEELIRNLGLEVLAVALVTLLLIRNLQASFWVICCVLFTLIDLLGSMYYLGLTIEISSSIMVLLCAGLAVDYAAHVGLEFTRATGTRNERTITTLAVIGPAVFNGGFSTFLAFVLLSASEAYLFSTFFKLFTSVVIFGLYHGLLFLPVILSLLGPKERKKINDEKNSTLQKQNGCWTVHTSSNGEDLSITNKRPNNTKTV